MTTDRVGRGLVATASTSVSGEGPGWEPLELAPQVDGEITEVLPSVDDRHHARGRHLLEGGSEFRGRLAVPVRHEERVPTDELVPASPQVVLVHPAAEVRVPDPRVSRHVER